MFQDSILLKIRAFFRDRCIIKEVKKIDFTTLSSDTRSMINLDER